MLEFIDHLHEPFLDPVVVERGQYRLPIQPGWWAFDTGKLEGGLDHEEFEDLFEPADLIPPIVEPTSLDHG